MTFYRHLTKIIHNKMLIEILMLPLLSGLTLGLFGRHIGRSGAMIFSTLNMWLAAFLSVYLLRSVAASHNYLHYNLGEWLSFVVSPLPSLLSDPFTNMHG